MNNSYKNLPSIEKLMTNDELSPLIEQFGRSIVLYAAKTTVQKFRDTATANSIIPSSLTKIISEIKNKTYLLTNSSLKKVINGTGVILHTNLGRSPLGLNCIEKIVNLNAGYTNLEFDLKSGMRTNRLVHLIEKLKFLTHAEDAIVVNNNAAAIILILKTLANDKETIISRGELVEIGGSFRIHEIMETSGTVVKEVGSTNKTRLEDYQKALSKKTGIILKVHKSNYSMQGFTSEVSIKELASFSKKNNIPFIYDQGSGLISNHDNLISKKEPDVISILKSGADIVTFSGDKLMGGPQAGIIVGKTNFINRLRKSPLIRALRIDKLTISALEHTIDHHIRKGYSPVFNLINTAHSVLESKAQTLAEELQKNNINCKVVKSTARYGGGTLPDTEINSYAIKLLIEKISSKQLYDSLLNYKVPIVGILKRGSLFFDILTIEEKDLLFTAKAISEIVSSSNK